MGQPEALIVSQFKGIHRPGLTSRISTRRVLDEPRELYNFHITDDGHLYMPESPNTLLHDFSLDGYVLTLHYVENPRGVIVQMSNGKIYHVAIDPSTGAFVSPTNVTLLATIAAGEEQWHIWVNGTLDYSLFGYMPRGSAGPVDDGKTWKLAGTYLLPTVTDITVTVDRATYSTLYKGRRFWVKRGRQVWFSALNTYDAAAAVDATFTISGDDAGNTYIDNPGFVSGMVAWEDVLIFFLTGSVWALSGDSPDTYSMHQVQTVVGNIDPWSLVRTDAGVITYGGRNLNARGLYLFTGSSAEKISDVVDDYLQTVGKTGGSLSAHRYIFTTARADPEERQFLLFDMRSRQWTAFDGYVNGAIVNIGSQVAISNGGVLYRHGSDILPRCPGRPGRIRLGYHDDQNPSGLNRYLAVKLTGRRWGTGIPTVTVTVTTSEGLMTSNPVDIDTDIFDNVVIPLNIRGAAIEVYLEFTPSNDDSELLIENLQVIMSRKGEKVSRG